VTIQNVRTRASNAATFPIDPNPRNTRPATFVEVLVWPPNYLDPVQVIDALTPVEELRNSLQAAIRLVEGIGICVQGFILSVEGVTTPVIKHPADSDRIGNDRLRNFTNFPIGAPVDPGVLAARAAREEAARTYMAEDLAAGNGSRHRRSTRTTLGGTDWQSLKGYIENVAEVKSGVHWRLAGFNPGGPVLFLAVAAFLIAGYFGVSGSLLASRGLSSRASRHRRLAEAGLTSPEPHRPAYHCIRAATSSARQHFFQRRRLLDEDEMALGTTTGTVPSFASSSRPSPGSSNASNFNSHQISGGAPRGRGISMPRRSDSPLRAAGVGSLFTAEERGFAREVTLGEGHHSSQQQPLCCANDNGDLSPLSD